MICACFIGKKRVGKTTKVAEFIKELAMPTYIFDVNNEYTRKFGVNNLYRGPIDIDKFLKAVETKRNSMIVVEEAAPFLSRKNSELVLMMQRSRHTNNVVLIVLHQIADLPADIYGRLDVICLFKTQDFPTALDRKFRSNEQFMSHFLSVKAASNEHFFAMFEPE